jgi:hypothetical protein
VQPALKPPRPIWDVSETGGYNQHCTTATAASAVWRLQASGSGVAQFWMASPW